jgi:hypothetical protein
VEELRAAKRVIRYFVLAEIIKQHSVPKKQTILHVEYKEA